MKLKEKLITLYLETRSSLPPNDVLVSAVVTGSILITFAYFLWLVVVLSIVLAVIGYSAITVLDYFSTTD